VFFFFLWFILIVNNNRLVFQLFVLPTLLLIVSLLGGIRLSIENNGFIFLKPQLICLLLASLVCISFVRTKTIEFSELISEDFPLLKNASNLFILLTLFAATVQIFNSLLPEKGIAFWVVSFCFLWTLWTNLFADFTKTRLLQSLGSLFGLAFVVKYLILQSLTSTSETWTQKLFETLTKEATFGLLEITKFSAATGFLQFAALATYMIAVFSFSSSKISSGVSSRNSSDKTS
jgi:hypothetical protein